MEREFEGRTAIVTGAGSGIGSEIARKLGAQGAQVVVADLNEAAADKVAAEIEGTGGAAAAVRQDVADPKVSGNPSNSQWNASAAFTWP